MIQPESNPPDDQIYLHRWIVSDFELPVFSLQFRDWLKNLEISLYTNATEFYKTGQSLINHQRSRGQHRATRTSNFGFLTKMSNNVDTPSIAGASTEHKHTCKLHKKHRWPREIWPGNHSGDHNTKQLSLKQSAGLHHRSLTGITKQIFHEYISRED